MATIEVNEKLQRTYCKDIAVAGGPKIPGYKAIVGSESGVISVMKNSYTPLHNSEFTDLVETMSNVSGFNITGYSDFYDGNIVLGYLKNTLENFNIGGNKIEDYIVLGNSHNGSRPFFVGTTTNLLRCTNQFSRLSSFERIKHTKSAAEKFSDLVEAFKMYVEARKKMYEKFTVFQDVKVDDEVRTLVIRRMLEIAETEKLEDVSTRKANQFELIENRIISETTELGNNLWGLFNGITKFVTHDLNVKNKGFGNVLGAAHSMNERAFETMEMVLQAKGITV